MRRAGVKTPPCEAAIREYFGGILDGKIVACKKMKQVSARQMT